MARQIDNSLPQIAEDKQDGQTLMFFKVTAVVEFQVDKTKEQVISFFAAWAFGETKEYVTLKTQ